MLDPHRWSDEYNEAAGVITVLLQKFVFSALQVRRVAANMANYILWPAVKLSKLSKIQGCLITAEHPNIELMLLTTPSNYFV